MSSIFNRSLQGHKPKTTKVPRIGTFDLETDGLGGTFILSAICDDTDRVTMQSSVPELVSSLLSKKHRNILWFAHNGGNYDFKYILSHIVELVKRGRLFDVRLLMTNDKVIEMTIYRWKNDKNPCKIRDSFALIPAPLAHVSKTFAPQYVKGHINFDSETFNPGNTEHLEYLRNDVLGLRYSLLTFYKTAIDHFGIVPSITAASTAMKAWKCTIPDDTIYFRTHADCEAFVRHSYFGGMVYINRVNVELENMVKLDISGAYGYAMKTFAMPVGEVTRTDTYEEGKIGFYKCRVIAPKNLEKYIIGVKSDTGVLWARGTFETVIDSYTYQYALTRGYKIEIIEGYYFDRQEYIFKEFIERCEKIEFVNKGNALGDTAKLMRNSLYGKFGTNPQKKEYGILKDIGVDGWEPTIDNTTGSPHDYLCVRDIEIDASYIMPQWASCITACVRIYLDQLDALLNYQFVYNDTDSSVVPLSVYEEHKHLLPNQIAYGRFKVETIYDSFCVLGPKAYMGKLREEDQYTDQNGNVVQFDMKAKGIPRRRLTPDIMRNKGVVEFDSLNGIIPILRDGKSIGHTIHRTVTDIRNSSNWVLIDDTTVLPVELQEG